MTEMEKVLKEIQTLKKTINVLDRRVRFLETQNKILHSIAQRLGSSLSTKSDK